MIGKKKLSEVKKKDMLLYLFFFVVLLILNRASIIGIKIPFGSSFLFSLVFLGKNALLLAPFYFISFIVFNFSFEGVVISLSTISALLLLFLIFKTFNKKISFIWTLFFCILGQIGYVYYNISSPAEMIVSVVVIIVCLMFFYICIQAMGVILNRGIQSRFTLDESICCSLFLIAVFSGLSDVYIFNVSFTNVIILFLLLLANKTLSKIAVIYLSALSGFGVGFATGSSIYISIYVSWAIMCIIFKGCPKICAPVSIILIDCVFGYFLNSYSFYSYLNVVALALSSIIYLCLPEKIFNYIKGFSYKYECNLANEYIVYGQKQLLKNKLKDLSNLFRQIQVSYRNLSVGEIDRKKVSETLSQELISNLCSGCINYNCCLAKEGVKNSIKQLFDFGLEKGKVSIIDANNLITSECKQLSALIGEVNQSLNNYFDYEKIIKTEDNSKMLIAEQFGGTGDIFQELSEFVIGGEKINSKASREVLDELTLNNIIANEVLVLEDTSGVNKIILIVRNADVLSPNISLSLKSVFKIDFAVRTCKMTRLAGWSVLCFVPAPKYEVSVGFACSGKSPDNISGDNYSFIKLNDNKVLFAISDGMGHGKRANEISNISLNLIESFYKSGFSSQTIISNVNKILLPAGEDNFATLDACIIDKSNGTADFVKMGASCSIIKSVDTSKLIMQESLPLGIVNKFGFKAQKCILKDQDIIVLASDGVVDVFDSYEDFYNFVNNEQVINVQMLASNILEEAESREREHKDDKTVMAIKVAIKV